MSRLNVLWYTLVVFLVLLSAGGVHALSCELQQTPTVNEGRIEIDVSIDLQVPDNQPVKAVTVKEYIPKELYKNTGNGIFTRFGLMWNVKTIEEGKTIHYTLRVPEISEPAIYELKTVIEYQNYDDLMTLEKTTRLVVYPDEGIVEIENGEDTQIVKREGVGYNKVEYKVPDFKAVSTIHIVNTVEVIADGTVEETQDEEGEPEEVEGVPEEGPEEVEEAEEEAKETLEVGEDKVEEDEGIENEGKKDKDKKPKGKKDKGKKDKKDKDKGKGKDK
jgi:hypothetical protein